MFGRKCAKADLTYLITPNQRVNLEVELISDEDREKIADLAPSVKYKATCIWVGKFDFQYFFVWSLFFRLNIWLVLAAFHQIWFYFVDGIIKIQLTFFFMRFIPLYNRCTLYIKIEDIYFWKNTWSRKFFTFLCIHIVPIVVYCPSDLKYFEHFDNGYIITCILNQIFMFPNILETCSGQK